MTKFFHPLNSDGSNFKRGSSSSTTPLPWRSGFNPCLQHFQLGLSTCTGSLAVSEFTTAHISLVPSSYITRHRTYIHHQLAVVLLLPHPWCYHRSQQMIVISELVHYQTSRRYLPSLCSCFTIASALAPSTEACS